MDQKRRDPIRRRLLPDSIGDEEAVERLVSNTTLALGAITAIDALASLFVEPRLWLSSLAIFASALVFVEVRGRRYG